jgi:hypothetical protein
MSAPARGESHTPDLSALHRAPLRCQVNIKHHPHFVFHLDGASSDLYRFDAELGLSHRCPQAVRSQIRLIAAAARMYAPLRHCVMATPVAEYQPKV